MKYKGKLFFIAIAMSCYSSLMASVTTKTNKADKFYSYKPGKSESFHIFYPGDKVIYNGHVYINIKVMNNSHLPNDSNMLGKYWKEVKVKNS
ncbi:hypothetical protein OAO18_00630 [Francisellaceae bacterium]|nr:hypothetical protein [Francisellaceae bacterium]